MYALALSQAVYNSTLAFASRWKVRVSRSARGKSLGLSQVFLEHVCNSVCVCDFSKPLWTSHFPAFTLRFLFSLLFVLTVSRLSGTIKVKHMPVITFNKHFWPFPSPQGFFALGKLWGRLVLGGLQWTNRSVNYSSLGMRLWKSSSFIVLTGGCQAALGIQAYFSRLLCSWRALDRIRAS